jgi:hypothetical protein
MIGDLKLTALKLRLAAIGVQIELIGEGVLILPRRFRDCRGTQLRRWASRTGGHGFKRIVEGPERSMCTPRGSLSVTQPGCTLATCRQSNRTADC